MSGTIKKPEALTYGDVFEDPLSEEEFHSGETTGPREKYRVLGIQQVGRFTCIVGERQSDKAHQELHLAPWVSLEVIDNIPVSDDEKYVKE